jgi:medium-chain acyl-[acyl-carrier-protein] hydrolase
MEETKEPLKLWAEEFTVHSYEVAQDGLVTVPALCRFMQEVAWHHAHHLGVGYSHLLDQNLVWILYAQIIHIHDYPAWGDKIIVQTWPSGKERLFYDRDFRILNTEGKTLAVAASRWIVIDINTRRPQRVYFKFRAEMDFLEHALVHEFRKPDITAAVPAKSFQVGYYDLDVNAHANNVRYIEWILESYNYDFHHSHRLQELEIFYVAEAVYGDQMVVKTEHRDDGNDQHLLSLSPRDKELCRARIKWLSKD